MGMWVILIGDADFGPASIKRMVFDGKNAIRDYGEKQFDVIFDDGYVSFQFDFDGFIRQDYTPDELRKLPYAQPQFILMRYSNQRVLKRVIGSEDFPQNILIDCDGVALGLEQMVDQSRLLNNISNGSCVL